MRNILVVVLVLAGVGWWFWTTTPQYSLQQIKEAVKTHDLGKFEKYVDVDSVSVRMVDDVLTEPMRKLLGPNVLGQFIIGGLLGVIKQPLVQGVKQDIRDLVESGDFKRKPNEVGQQCLSLGSMDEKLGFRKHAFRGVASMQIQGKLALLTLTMHNEKFKSDLLLQVKMRNMDGYWQATEVTNFPEFIVKIMSLQASDTGGSAPAGAAHEI